VITATSLITQFCLLQFIQFFWPRSRMRMKYCVRRRASKETQI